MSKNEGLDKTRKPVIIDDAINEGLEKPGGAARQTDKLEVVTEISNGLSLFASAD